MMTFNSTCVGNSTSLCSPQSSKTGLTVGLTVFFVLLLLIIGVGVIAFKMRGRLRSMVPFRTRGSLEKEDDLFVETPRTVKECHEHMSRPNTSAQVPIYENVTRVASGYDISNTQIRSSCEAEEEVYLQCDGIYSNDPACNPSIHADQEDDIYIVPD